MKASYKIYDLKFIKITLNKNVLFFLVCIFLLQFGNNYAQTLADCKAIKEEGFTAMDRLDYPVALEYLTKAQVIAEKNIWYLEIFETRNNIGLIYTSLSDYGEALNYFLDAYTVAIKHLDASNEMSVLNNIAVIYSMEKNFDKGREYYLKAYHLAKKVNNESKIAIYAFNLAKIAHINNELDEAEIYLEEIKTFSKINDAMQFQRSYMRAENYLLRGEYEMSKKILFDLESQSSKKDFANKDNNSATLSLISKAYFLEKNYERSIFYLQKCLKVTEDFETRAYLYSTLSEAYVFQNQYNNALGAMKMMVASNDSISKRKNQNLYESNKVKFEVLNYKTDLEASIAGSKLDRKIFSIAIVFLAVLIFFVYRTFRNRAIKLEQKKIIAEGQQRIIGLELEKEKSDNLILEKQLNENAHDALLEREQLKREIEERNRKLSAKALYLSGRNEMIEEMVQSLSKLQDVDQNDLIKTHIKALREHLKSDAEWDEFIIHFEEVNQGLLTVLKVRHPTLNSNDIRFICYIYMNLSFKEIGSILNITQEACRKRKERISIKMGVDKNVSFYEYLSSIGRPMS